MGPEIPTVRRRFIAIPLLQDDITAPEKKMQQVSTDSPRGFDPVRPWRSHPRETIATGVLAAIAMVAIGNASLATPVVPGPGSEAAGPARLSNEIRDLSPETALQLNAKVPLAAGPNPPAAPFHLGNAPAEARSRALDCLTSAIYYEAAQEPDDGQRAVAQVVLNRVRHPAFPNSICGVVYEGSTRVTGCQFTFTCDGSMRSAPLPSLWNRARKVAEAALAGYVFAPVGHATHYHADYVVPYWASSLTKNLVAGAHIFYRWPGSWGLPSSYTQRWSGSEGNPAALRTAALSVVRSVAPVRTAEATVEKLEQAGARVIEGKNGRVRLLFTPEAREAVEKVKVTPYVERVEATDNLRFALNGADSSPNAQPFGSRKEAPAQGPGPAAAE